LNACDAPEVNGLKKTAPRFGRDQWTYSFSLLDPTLDPNVVRTCSCVRYCSCAIHGVDAWIAKFTQQAVAESHARRPGGEAMLARMSEMMFVDAVRRYADHLPTQSAGWLAGLRDRFVGRALALMHEQLAQDWTIDELGRRVGLSRSYSCHRDAPLWLIDSNAITRQTEECIPLQISSKSRTSPTELRRLTDAVLSSPAFVTQGGAGDETEQDTASRSVRECRARKNTVADRAEFGGNCSAGAVDVLASGNHRDGGKQ
jgi:hypothetical protein